MTDLCLPVVQPLYFRYWWLDNPFHKTDIILPRKRKYKTKGCAAASLPGNLGEKHHCTTLLHCCILAAPSDRTTSIMLCITIFLCHFLPAPHNLIMCLCFLARGLCFLSSRTTSAELNLDASSKWGNVFAFCFSLASSNFHTLVWQIFFLPKMRSTLKLP